MYLALKDQLDITMDEWKDQAEFQSYFTGNTKQLKLILFLDEMDTALHSPYCDALLPTLRNLKGISDQHGLKVLTKCIGRVSHTGCCRYWCL